jgi:N-acetylglucosaminyldiphosphoundecaprenol N-acetyl-beta-D-mannosaminyltransferase
VEFRVGSGSVAVTVRDEAALLAALAMRLRAGQGFTVATLNLDHLAKLRHDAAFRAAYAQADLVTADGNPVVWLARLAGRPVALLPGSDLMMPVLALCAREGAPVGLMGSTAEALDRAADRLAAAIPGLDIRARLAPPMGFDPEGPEAQAALDRMAGAGARVVLLALGAPKQERLAAMGRGRHPGMGFLCIGAGLDFVAGHQRRAPRWMRRLALEWLWRLAGDPRRLGGRYARAALVLPGHAARALKARRRSR